MSESSLTELLTTWAVLCRSFLTSSIVLVKVTAATLLTSVVSRMFVMHVIRDVTWALRSTAMVLSWGGMRGCWAVVEADE